MCVININPYSGTPIYKQIKEQIKLGIATNRILPGERLSSVRNLSNDLNVSPGSVVRAYQELRREGILQMRCRLGTTIVEFNNHEESYLRNHMLAEEFNEFMNNLLGKGYTLNELKTEFKSQILTRNEALEKDSPKIFV